MQPPPPSQHGGLVSSAGRDTPWWLSEAGAKRVQVNQSVDIIAPVVLHILSHIGHLDEYLVESSLRVPVIDPEPDCG
jgi:hypothetical protein